MSAQKRLMTKSGFARLSKEREQLYSVERKKVVNGIAVAAAEGDRSENAEYIYGKKKLREIDKRLQYLGNLLKDVDVVDPLALTGTKVVFGATVQVVDEEDNKKEWMIVGVGEADTKVGTISYQAPVAKALLGKEIGDVVMVRRPKGEIEYEIVGVRFAQAPEPAA